MNESKELADILAESREYIENNGWWKGALVGPNKRQVCAWGAIMKSQGIESITEEYRLPAWARPVVEAVVRAAGVTAVRRNGVIHVTDLTGWNDAKDRTRQQVLDAFMKAEKIARGGVVSE